MKLLFALLGLVVFSAQAATHVFDVPEGQTKTFAEMLTASGETLATSGDLRLYALDTTGRHVRELPVTREGEALVFACMTEGGTFYYELTAKE